MIKVKKRNHAQLEIITEPSIEMELSEFFCFFVPGYQFMPSYKNKMWDGKVRLFDSREKTLPSGLFKYLLEFANTPGRDYHVEPIHDNYYGMAGAEDASIDMDFIKNYNFTSKGEKIEPRDYQLNAVEHGLRNKQALIISPTASGKSFIIYNLVRHYLENNSRRVLLVVPTTSLVRQMYGDFDDYSEFDDGFDAEKLCHMIYAGRPKFERTERVIITTWQSIYKLPGPWFEQFGMVIGDEAHNFKAKSLISILNKCRDAEYRFGTTGTLDGTQTHRLQLEGGFGPVYRVISTKQLMDSGALSELSINVLLMKYEDKECQMVSKLKYQDEISYIVAHEKRNNFIKNLALDQDGNTLVLFQLVEKHGKPLYDLIKAGAHERRKIFFVSGQTDVDIREDVRKITETQKNAIIVASLGTFSTGINIRNIHNIIFASPSKSQIKVLQSIGRGLRKSDDGRKTILYDIADDFHWKNKKNYTLNHSAERIKIYAKEKFDYKIFEVK